MKKTALDTINVANVLEALTLDDSIYTVLRCYDNEVVNTADMSEDEIALNTVERKAYANIRENDTNRSVIKLWGHKQFVAVEISKTLRKRSEYDVMKKVYTDKKLDKNNNYICDSVSDAVALCKDFLKQCEKVQSASTTTVSKKKVDAKKEA